MQWRNEIAAHTEGMKVLVWHGASRISDVEELKKYDVVWLLLTCGLFSSVNGLSYGRF